MATAYIITSEDGESRCLRIHAVFSTKVAADRFIADDLILLHSECYNGGYQIVERSLDDKRWASPV